MKKIIVVLVVLAAFGCVMPTEPQASTDTRTVDSYVDVAHIKMVVKLLRTSEYLDRNDYKAILIEMPAAIEIDVTNADSKLDTTAIVGMTDLIESITRLVNDGIALSDASFTYNVYTAGGNTLNLVCTMEESSIGATSAESDAFAAAISELETNIATLNAIGAWSSTIVLDRSIVTAQVRVSP